MKRKLDKTGLRLIELGAALAVIFFIVMSFATSSFSAPLFFVIVLPSVFLTGITLKYRLFGGLLAAVVSALMLVPISIVLSSPEATTPLFGLFAILICFLLGGAFILSSLAIRSPRKGNAKA